MKNVIKIVGIILVVIAISVGIILGNRDDIKDNNENVLVVGLDDSFPPMGFRNENNEYIYISAKTGSGIEKLEQKINDRFNLIKYNNNEELILINERHKIALIKCKNNLIKAKKQIEEGQTIDLITIDITEALQNINSITGENVSEEVVNEIFEKFCLGK